MRGIGNGYGGFFGGLGVAGAAAGLAALAMSAAPDPFSPVGPRRRNRESRGTGWQDRSFEHPQGDTSFRPTGSKRSRRRAAKRGK